MGMIAAMIMCLGCVGYVMTASPTEEIVTLPADPKECSKIMIKLEPPYKSITVRGEAPILGESFVILTMPHQTLEVQYRGREWRDPIKDCGGVPTS